MRKRRKTFLADVFSIGINLLISGSIGIYREFSEIDYRDYRDYRGCIGIRLSNFIETCQRSLLVHIELNHVLLMKCGLRHLTLVKGKLLVQHP